MLDIGARLQEDWAHRSSKRGDRKLGSGFLIVLYGHVLSGADWQLVESAKGNCFTVVERSTGIAKRKQDTRSRGLLQMHDFTLVRVEAAMNARMAGVRYWERHGPWRYEICLERAVIA